MNCSARSLVLPLVFFFSGPLLAQPVALEGGTVHLGTGEVLEGATVLFEGRRILAVGSVELPPQTVRHDVRGHHVYPGLIDADSVLGLTEISSISATVDVREVGEINPNLRAELAINPDSELLPVARTGGVLHALSAGRSGLISGSSALIRLHGWTWEDMTARAPLFLHVRWPRMRIDRSGRSSKTAQEQLEAREGLLKKIREAFGHARAYFLSRSVPRLEQDEEDVKWDALQAVFRGTLPLAIHAQTLQQLRAALDWVDQEGLAAVVVGGADAWRISDELARRNVPVILSPVQALPQRRYEAVDTPFTNPARLHQAGVRIAFSSGGSTFNAANARNLRLQAAQAVAYGLPPEQAVHALTLGAAEILGMADKLGSLEAEKEATLFVASGDILALPTRVTQAWIAGQPVELVDRQLRLYERYRARPLPREE